MPVTASANLAGALEKLTTGGVRKVILQPSDATGDISHVAPLLGIFADYGVLVFRSDQVAFDKRDHIPNAYVDQFGIGQNRVAWLNAPLSRAEKAGIGGSMTLTTCTTVLISALRASRGLGSAPDGAAMQAAGASKATFASGVKAVMRGPHFSPDTPSSEGSASHAVDGIIQEYLGELGILPDYLDRDWVVLWGRVSKEIHEAANSSTQAIAQLARLCHDQGVGVILAGQINHEGLAKRDPEIVGRSIYVGEFWRRLEPGAKHKYTIGAYAEPRLATRPQQVRLFYVLGKLLKRQGHRLVHVGMRSGGLDAYAFSGQRVLYLLPTHFGDERMEAVVGGLADVKGFSFDKEALSAPVRPWQYAPTAKQAEGNLAFVDQKLAAKRPNQVPADQKRAYGDAKDRLGRPGAEPKEAVRGFQPGEDSKVMKRILEILAEP
jgi:hypothetical protein